MALGRFEAPNGNVSASPKSGLASGCAMSTLVGKSPTQTRRNAWSGRGAFSVDGQAAAFPGGIPVEAH